MWDSGVGLAAALHWVLALQPASWSEHPPRPRWIEYDLTESPLREGILTHPITVRDGELQLPTGDGLGVELDLDGVERHTVLPEISWPPHG